MSTRGLSTFHRGADAAGVLSRTAWTLPMDGNDGADDLVGQKRCGIRSPRALFTRTACPFSASQFDVGLGADKPHRSLPVERTSFAHAATILSSDAQHSAPPLVMRPHQMTTMVVCMRPLPAHWRHALVVHITSGRRTRSAASQVGTPLPAACVAQHWLATRANCKTTETSNKHTLWVVNVQGTRKKQPQCGQKKKKHKRSTRLSLSSIATANCPSPRTVRRSGCTSTPRRAGQQESGWYAQVRTYATHQPRTPCCAPPKGRRGCSRVASHTSGYRPYF